MIKKGLSPVVNKRINNIPKSPLRSLGTVQSPRRTPTRMNNHTGVFPRKSPSQSPIRRPGTPFVHNQNATTKNSAPQNYKPDERVQPERSKDEPFSPSAKDLFTIFAKNRLKKKKK